MIDSYKFNKPLDEIYQLPKMVDSISLKDIKEIANEVFAKDILQAELNPKE
jgi:hypothetical protein